VKNGKDLAFSFSCFYCEKAAVMGPLCFDIGADPFITAANLLA
jgi:hypothetical protein